MAPATEISQQLRIRGDLKDKGLSLAERNKKMALYNRAKSQEAIEQDVGDVGLESYALSGLGKGETKEQAYSIREDEDIELMKRKTERGYDVETGRWKADEIDYSEVPFKEGGRTGFKAAGAVFPYDIIKGITEDPKKTTALGAPIVGGAAIANPRKTVEIAKEISKKTGNLGKQVLNKALGIAFSPTGLAGLLAWHAKGKDAKEIATDPWTYSYAPFLGVGAQAVEFITKNIKSPAIKSVIQRGLSLGVFTPAQIIKASRITTPAGWLAVIGTAIAKMPEDKKSVFLKEVMGPEFGEKLKEEKEEYYTEGEHYAMDGIESLMK